MEGSLLGREGSGNGLMEWAMRLLGWGFDLGWVGFILEIMFGGPWGGGAGGRRKGRVGGMSWCIYRIVQHEEVCVCVCVYIVCI